MAEKWLTVKQAAVLFQVNKRTILDWVKKGTLEGVKFGHRTVRIPLRDGGEADGVQGQGEGRAEEVSQR